MKNGPYNTDLYNLDAGYMYIVYKGGSEGGDNHLVLFQIFSYRINLINVLKGTSRDIYKKIPYIRVYFGSVFDYIRIMVMLIKLAQNPCTRL